MFVSRTLTSISYFPNFVSSTIQKDYNVPLQIHQYVAMLDNGNSLVVEGRTVTLPAAERSFKSITGMVELVRGIVPMGSAQTAEFKWVSPRGVVTPVDMQLIEDQLERFANSPGHILHAKIIGGTRDGVVALVTRV
jgi:hypothetical protein